MSKQIHPNTIYNSTSLSTQDKDMLREAVRGEFDGYKYLRDVGIGAAAGAAGGAVAGGGIGSLPAAAVGAIGGAAFGLGSNAVADIAYNVYDDEGKASWQASDMQERLEKLGGMLAGKTKTPSIGQLLSGLGTQYKNFIDISLNKNVNEEQKKIYEQNLFNPVSEAHQEFKSALPQQKTASNKFIRIAYDTSTPGMVGGVSASAITDKLLYTYLTKPNSISPEITEAIKQQLTNNPTVQNMFNDMKSLIEQRKIMPNNWNNLDSIPKSWNEGYDAFQKSPLTKPGDQFLDDLIPDAQGVLQHPMQESWDASSQIANQRAEQMALNQGKNLLQPKNLLNATWKGVKGLGVGLAVDFASNWLIDTIDMAMTGGEINMFRRELDDLSKIITEINRLTSNNPEIVYAGNILWTNLKQIDRMLGEANEAKNNKASNPNLQTETPVQYLKADGI